MSADIAFEGMGNAHRGSDWMLANPDSMLDLLYRDLASAVKRTNEFMGREKIPVLLRNIRELKDGLGGFSLPWPGQLNYYYTDHPDLYAHCLSEARKLMTNGYYTFQQADKSGGLMATALALDLAPVFYGQFMSGIGYRWSGNEATITDSLVEAILTLGPTNDFYHRLIDEDKWNWVRGWQGYDPRLRFEHTGPEPLPNFKDGGVVRNSDNYRVEMGYKFTNPEFKRFYITPINTPAEKLLTQAAVKHKMPTEERAVNEEIRNCIRMDFSQENWLNSIMRDEFINPKDSPSGDSVPPIQHLDDLLENGQMEYTFSQ